MSCCQTKRLFLISTVNNYYT